jgi:hypothetical protein
MDINHQNIKKSTNIDDTIKFVNDTYDNLSYFELYGNSIIIFILSTLFVFVVFSYCKIMETKEDIAKDWVNQRCKPQNMMFAGLITHPEGTTAFEYTNENFQYCVQSILSNIANYSLEPFQYMISSLTTVFSAFSSSVQQTREVINKLRNNIKGFTENIFGRILNIMIPIQKIFISLMDTFQKIQGVMTSSLYTMLGTYYTLQALMGAIVELMVKMLVVLVVIIVGLWVMPFTWPAAASMSAVFLGISIPLSIIIYFLTEVLHVKSSAIPKLRCFDENTSISLKNGDIILIKDIKPNQILKDGSIVTAKIKVLSKYLDMYNLNNIIVSGCHIVNYDNHWIPVYKHPNAIKINYNLPYLYCLNTNTKSILINNITFTDWDEIYNDELKLYKEYNLLYNFHKGFHYNDIVKTLKGDKKMSKITIGEKLIGGGIVYGIVEFEKKINLLISNNSFIVNNIVCQDYNTTFEKLQKILSKEYV